LIPLKSEREEFGSCPPERTTTISLPEKN